MYTANQWTCQVAYFAFIGIKIVCWGVQTKRDISRPLWYTHRIRLQEGAGHNAILVSGLIMVCQPKQITKVESPDAPEFVQSNAHETRVLFVVCAVSQSKRRSLLYPDTDWSFRYEECQ